MECKQSSLLSIPVSYQVNPCPSKKKDSSMLLYKDHPRP